MFDLILVVDDNRDAADMLALLIRKLGHDVITAYDGQEASTSAANDLPDMALIDLAMPAVDGYDVASSIRRQPGGAQMVLVAVTGLSGEAAKRQAFDAGFDLFLTKPVSLESLQKTLDVLNPIPALLAAAGRCG